MMTAPITRGDGKLAGMLVGSMDLMGDNVLGDIAKIRIGKEGYLALTTADRILVMHPNKDRIMKPIPLGNRLYDAAVGGYEGSDETITTAGIPMLTSVKRMKVNGWMMVANYPLAEAYAAISEMKRYLLAASVTAVVCVFFMTLFLIRRFTAPLAQFTRHVMDLPVKRGAEKQLHLETRDEIGTLSQVFNTMVVELDQQQDSLRESENLFRSLSEKSLVGIYVIQDGLFRYVNPRFAEIFKYSQDELTEKLGPKDLTHPDDRTAVQEYIRKRISGEAMSVHYLFRGLTKTRDIIDAEVYGSATVYQGRPAIIGTVMDITERKRAEEDLRESEERFRELADSLPQTVFEIDSEGRFLYVNRAALETFGYTRVDVERGLNVADVIAPQDRERALQKIRERMRGSRNEHQEYMAIRKDGTTFPGTVHAIPIVRDGRPAGLRGILIDITDRKRFEAEVLRSQKLESIGVMAGGIAHDFNNILTGILGNLSLAKIRLDRSNPLYQRIDEAEKASLHARDLTQQLLTFARGGSPVKKLIALGPLIRDAVGFAVRGSNVRVEYRLDEDLKPVEADAGQLAQVFHNLVINACQAMPRGGTLVIAAQNCGADAAITAPALSGDCVQVQIEDQGIGIPPEHLSKIFDPYFTTKQRGSGLGLAIAYSVVKSHGGHIDVASILGRGTTFTLHLPSAEGRAAPRRAEEAAIIGGKGRVLVMDDEEIVRAVVMSMLIELGYEAVTSRDGSETIRLYRDAKAAGRGFDAVIMDLTIPGGMGGKEAIRELREFDPHVRAIVSSGYSDDPIMADFQSYGFSGVVKKPYRVSELSETLNRVIHGPSDR
jgi:PAS domain S-box-containing protein